MSMLWIFTHNEQYTGGRHRTRAVCERRTRDLSVIVITLQIASIHSHSFFFVMHSVFNSFLLLILIFQWLLIDLPMPIVAPLCTI